MKTKKIIVSILLCLVVPFTMLFTGCSIEDFLGNTGTGTGTSTTQTTSTKCIVNFEKTSTVGLVDTYTLTYSDGTTSTFTVTNGEKGADGQNGQDGTNGQNVTITEIYEKYKTETGNASLTYAEFLSQYLTLNASTNAQTINKCLLSCLKVYTEFCVAPTIDYNKTEGWHYDKALSHNAGSAVIYKIDADYTYVITNYHVVYAEEAYTDNNAGTEIDQHIARKIYGYLYGSEDSPVATTEIDSQGYTVYNYGAYGISFDYVGGSATHDIALLRVATADITKINPSIRAITFADNYNVGETAIAIGNAEDEGISVTEGIISVDNENIQLAIGGETRTYRSIRIDTALYAGNSGGGLFNTDGKLIGITNAGDGDDQNVNYAVPLEIVRGVVENLMANANSENIGKVQATKIVLGVTVLSADSKYVYDSVSGLGHIEEKVVVYSVASGSLAESFGLAVGDILKSIEVNGTTHEIIRNFDISNTILTLRADDKIKINYTRGETDLQTDEYTILAADLEKVA